MICEARFGLAAGRQTLIGRRRRRRRITSAAAALQRCRPCHMPADSTAGQCVTAVCQLRGWPVILWVHLCSPALPAWRPDGLMALPGARWRIPPASALAHDSAPGQPARGARLPGPARGAGDLRPLSAQRAASTVEQGRRARGRVGAPRVGGLAASRPRRHVGTSAVSSGQSARRWRAGGQHARTPAQQHSGPAGPAGVGNGPGRLKRIKPAASGPAGPADGGQGTADRHARKPG